MSLFEETIKNVLNELYKNKFKNAKETFSVILNGHHVNYDVHTKANFIPPKQDQKFEYQYTDTIGGDYIIAASHSYNLSPNRNSSYFEIDMYKTDLFKIMFNRKGNHRLIFHPERNEESCIDMLKAHVPIIIKEYNKYIDKETKKNNNIQEGCKELNKLVTDFDYNSM